MCDCTELSDTRRPVSALALGAAELEALLLAADDRADVAEPDALGALTRGRAALELELARLIH